MFDSANSLLSDRLRLLWVLRVGVQASTRERESITVSNIQTLIVHSLKEFRIRLLRIDVSRRDHPCMECQPDKSLIRLQSD